MKKSNFLQSILVFFFALAVLDWMIVAVLRMVASNRTFSSNAQVNAMQSEFWIQNKRVAVWFALFLGFIASVTLVALVRPILEGLGL